MRFPTAKILIFPQGLLIRLRRRHPALAGWGSILTFVLFCGCLNPKLKDEVCFNNQCLVVEIAFKEGERFKGLQFRKTLQKNYGMLFIFPKPQRYSFWMKDTLIPLDIVWFDFNRKVVHIEYNVPSCEKDPCPTYYPPLEALYVLEVNAGVANQMRLQNDVQVDFRLNKFLK